jgi:hypothetical protein
VLSGKVYISVSARICRHGVGVFVPWNGDLRCHVIARRTAGNLASCTGLYRLRDALIDWLLADAFELGSASFCTRFGCKMLGVF